MIAGTGPLADATLKALAAHHANGGTVASVCAGTDALGRAGLLDGRRCTTHHDIQDELAKRYRSFSAGGRQVLCLHRS